MTFGALLRDARERKGISVSVAARQLRIRADILHAIEENDFSRMPPRGYTRNMVNAYARLVDLNPSEITRMYLDEVSAYETGRMRSDANSMRTTRQRSQGASRTSRESSREGRGSRSSRTRGNDGPASRRTPLGRSLVEDRNADRVHPSRHTIAPGSHQYTNLCAPPQNVSQPKSKLPIVVIAAAVVIVLIIVLALVFGNKSSQPAAETPTVPITGLSDTSNKQADSSESATEDSASSEDDSSKQSASSAVAPTKATFTYKVASGGSVYIEVYEGDSSTATIAQTVTGPSEKSFDVTSKLKFISDASSAVECTLDGEKVDLTENSNGMYAYTVDFASILSKWQQEHGVSSSASSSNSSQTTSSTSSSSNSSSSSSSTKSTNSGSTSSSRSTN